MPSRCRRQSQRTIRARRGKRHTELCNEPARQAVFRASQCHSRAACCHCIGNDCGTRHHNCYRPWPEQFTNRLCCRRPVGSERLSHGHIGHVHDQRIGLRPPFGRKDFLYRHRIQCHCRQAIHRFGRNSHQATCNENLRGAIKCLLGLPRWLRLFCGPINRKNVGQCASHHNRLQRQPIDSKMGFSKTKTMAGKVLWLQ